MAYPARFRGSTGAGGPIEATTLHCSPRKMFWLFRGSTSSRGPIEAAIYDRRGTSKAAPSRKPDWSAAPLKLAGRAINMPGFNPSARSTGAAGPIEARRHRDIPVTFLAGLPRSTGAAAPLKHGAGRPNRRHRIAFLRLRLERQRPH